MSHAILPIFKMNHIWNRNCEVSLVPSGRTESRILEHKINGRVLGIIQYYHLCLKRSIEYTFFLVVYIVTETYVLFPTRILFTLFEFLVFQLLA